MKRTAIILGLLALPVLALSDTAQWLCTCDLTTWACNCQPVPAPTPTPTPTPPSSSLLSDLVAAYPLTDAGDRAGDNDLTNVGGLVFGGDGVQCNGAGYLVRQRNEALDTGDVDFALSGWVWVDALTGLHQMFWSKGQEWYIRATGYGQYDFATAHFDHATTTAFVTPGAWHWVYIEHNTTSTDTITVRVDNTITATHAITQPITDLSKNFEVCSAFTGIQPLTGRVRDLYFWKGRVPTSAEQACLWNGSVGGYWPFAGLCE